MKKLIVVAALAAEGAELHRLEMAYRHRAGVRGALTRR